MKELKGQTPEEFAKECEEKESRRADWFAGEFLANLNKGKNWHYILDNQIGSELWEVERDNVAAVNKHNQ